MEGPVIEIVGVATNVPQKGIGQPALAGDLFTGRAAGRCRNGRDDADQG